METIEITRPSPHVALVSLNRPQKLNAMSLKLFEELEQTMENLSADPDIRCIIIAGNGRAFCAGIDLNALMSLSNTTTLDPARIALRLRSKITKLQRPINSIEECDKPVIAVVHGYCLGAGVDLITACDIRICASDAVVSIREIEIGMTADIGTIQRLPKVVGNISWVREMIYTGRNANADEATKVGLFSNCLETKEKALQAALDLANTIASKSPVAVIGSKKTLNFSRDHSVTEGLEFITNWNACALQCTDLVSGVTAQLQKTKAIYPKL